MLYRRVLRQHQDERVLALVPPLKVRDINKGKRHSYPFVVSLSNHGTRWFSDFWDSFIRYPWIPIPLGTIRQQAATLAQERYKGNGHTHLTELPAEREGVTRPTVRRLLLVSGQSSLRQRRPPQHCYDPGHLQLCPARTSRICRLSV
jgi:hypothetical protein